MKFNKRGGVVGDLISGTGGLVILTVVVLVIVSTLLGAGLISDDKTTHTGTASNETGAWLNTTTYTVDNSAAQDFAALTITSALNATDNSSILTGNFTVSGAGFTNSSALNWADVLVSYTYTYTVTDVAYSTSANAMAGNFTEGIDNVSSKIPTILLIAAVVLLFGVIVLLVKQAGAMGIGSGGASL